MANLTVSVVNETDGIRFILEGRINASNAYYFSDALRTALTGYEGKYAAFDCEKLAYISSAGLRELFTLFKRRNLAVKLEKVNHEVQSILNISGFSQFFEVNGGN